LLRAWSAGCASGEEPYTLALLWNSQRRCGTASPELNILATDVRRDLLKRAEVAEYSLSSLREIPEDLRKHFAPCETGFRLQQQLRSPVTFSPMDLRSHLPEGRFDLILCRNLAFTYFDEAQQLVVLQQFADRLFPQGALVLGRHETLPTSSSGFELEHPEGIWRLMAKATT
jgi:chemotaxis protein methyltransferase CheR